MTAIPIALKPASFPRQKPAWNVRSPTTARNARNITCGVSGIVSSPVSWRMRAPLIAATGGRTRRSIMPRKLSECGQVDFSCRCFRRLASPILPLPSLAEGRDHGFDGEKQGSALGRIFDEFRAFHVETHRRIILGVDEHRPNADALRGDRCAA